MFNNANRRKRIKRRSGRKELQIHANSERSWLFIEFFFCRSRLGPSESWARSWLSELRPSGARREEDEPSYNVPPPSLTMVSYSSFCGDLIPPLEPNFEESLSPIRCDGESERVTNHEELISATTNGSHSGVSSCSRRSRDFIDPNARTFFDSSHQRQLSSLLKDIGNSESPSAQAYVLVRCLNPAVADKFMEKMMREWVTSRLSRAFMDEVERRAEFTTRLNAAEMTQLRSLLTKLSGESLNAHLNLESNLDIKEEDLALSQGLSEDFYLRFEPSLTVEEGPDVTSRPAIKKESSISSEDTQFSRGKRFRVEFPGLSSPRSSNDADSERSTRASSISRYELDSGDETLSSLSSNASDIRKSSGYLSQLFASLARTGARSARPEEIPEDLQILESKRNVPDNFVCSCNKRSEFDVETVFTIADPTRSQECTVCPDCFQIFATTLRDSPRGALAKLLLLGMKDREKRLTLKYVGSMGKKKDIRIFQATPDLQSILEPHLPCLLNTYSGLPFRMVDDSLKFNFPLKRPLQVFRSGYKYQVDFDVSCECRDGKRIKLKFDNVSFTRLSTARSFQLHQTGIPDYFPVRK